jgi:hypothetical protein
VLFLHVSPKFFSGKRERTCHSNSRAFGVYSNINMAPSRLGLGHDSPSSFHVSKEMPSIAPTKIQEEAEKVKKTLPKVVALDANTCTVDEIVEVMKVAGGLIIRNAVPLEALDLIESK